jgi:glycosidase
MKTTAKSLANASFTLVLFVLLVLTLAVAAAAGASQSAGASPAYGSPTLDGVRDAIYGAAIAADPAGDLANPGPGGWSGTAWTDQTALYCQNDDQFLYVYADLAQYSQAGSSGQIGLLIDLGTTAGGSADPWANAITFNHANRPDYVARGNIAGMQGGDNGWTELRAWGGAAWSAGGTNWGGISGGGQAGGKIAYSNANGVEFKIPLSDIGNPISGSTVNLEFFATQGGGSKGAYDTVPSDDQSTGWDDPTTLVNYASCALTTSGPPTSTPTTGPSPTPTSTPTATPTPPSGCTGATVGDGVVVVAGLFHDSTLLAYRDPQAPIQPSGSAVLRLRTCQNDVQQVQVLVWRTGDPLAAPSFTYPAAVASSDGTYSLWEATVPGDTVNLWYQFRVTDAPAVGQFNPISGNTGPGKWYTGALANPSWSLPVVLPTPTPPPDFAVPTWIDDAVIYQIFPDRFRNGSPANDPVDGTLVYEPAPDGCAGYPHPRPNPGVGGCQWDRRNWTDPLLIPSWGLDFHGGDLQGVIDKINANYFNDLGVNTLYLNPIFESSSNHGYDTNDYFNVRAIFGNNALFDQLITAANAKGLRVILDGVFNHAGMDSVYIDKNKTQGGACASASSPQRPWFTPGSAGAVFACDGGWGWKGWYNYATLPEFVDASAGVRDLFFRGGAAGAPSGKSVSQFWQERGIAGWRYDVAQDITHDFFQAMRPYVKGTNASGTAYGNSEQLMLGEVTGGCDWGLYQSYINGGELDSVMNYCFRDWATGFGNGNPPSQFNNSYNQFRALFPPSAWKGFMNLISTHDSPRMLNLLNGDKGKLKLVTLLQFTLPGAPSVYYGDEVGMGGGGDPDNRRPFAWPDINGGNNGNGDTYDADMYQHFKTLLGIRNAYSALRGGDVQTLLVDDASGLYSYLRSDANHKLIVVLNNKTAAATATIPVGGLFLNDSVFTDLLNTGTLRGPQASYTVSNGQLVVPVAGRWGSILLFTSGPLAVNLASFNAEPEAGGVRVAWETVSEADNAGFNLYRSDSAAGALALLAHVPSQAPGSTVGFSYTWTDQADLTPGATYYYWLEDVSLSGATTLHGPVSATVQAPTAVTLASLSTSGEAQPWQWVAALVVLAALGGLATAASRPRRPAS